MLGSTIVSMSVFPRMHLTIEPNCGSVLGNEGWRVEMRLMPIATGLDDVI